MAKIGELYVEIDAKIEGLQRELGNVKSKLEGIKGPTDSLSNSTNTLSGSFKSLVTKLLAVGAAYVGIREIKNLAGSFLNVATQVENYTVRLKALLGSQEAAADAMEFFQEVASKVPFTLQEVIAAGTTVTAFGADLEKWTPILTDLAAVMGLDLTDAANALGRAYARGAGAADIFRERGILQIIKDSAKLKGGIDDITKLTLPEFRDAMYDAFTDPEGKISGAADDLSRTWDGMISMLSDAWFQFRQAVMESGVFDMLKDGLKSVLDKIIMLRESGKLKEWAENTADAIKGLISTVSELNGILLSSKGPITSVAERLSELYLNFFNLESPAQEFKRIEEEATLRAIEFKNSLKALSPSMEEIREHFEKGEEHANAWMEEIKKADDETFAFKQTIKELGDWWGETKRLWEEAHPVIKTTATTIETEVHPALKNLINTIDVLNNVSPTLKETFEEAMLSARDLGDVIPNYVVPKIQELPTESDAAANELEDDADRVKSRWQEMADGIRTNWTENLSDILQGAQSLKDGLKDIFNHIKDMFFDMVAEMITKWIFDFIQDALVGGIKQASSTIIDTMTGLGENFTQTLRGLSNAAGGIWTGLGAFAGTFLGNLLGGGAAGFDHHDSGHLKFLMENSTALYPILEENQKIQNNTSRLIEMWNHTKGSVDALRDIKKILKKIGGFQHEGIAWRPQLAMVGESGPEAIVRLDKFARGESKFSGAFPTNMPPVNIYISAMDSQDVYRFMTTKGREAIEEMFKANVRGITREMKNQMGKY